MGWDTSELQQYVPDLQALADVKYDEYGNYGPGGKFIENLAGWLAQFPEERRQVALEFVMNHLVFISETEMRHLISLVPTTIIDPILRRIADAHGLASYRIAEIERHDDFVALRRKTWSSAPRRRAARSVASRLAALPRAVPADAGPSIDQLRKLVNKMQKAAIPEEQRRFEHVFLFDDFSGAGRPCCAGRAAASTGRLSACETP